MTNPIKMKTCPRCGGTGNVGGPVVYAGMPGGCFTCAMAGQIPVDKFYREMGTTGKFFGISGTILRSSGPGAREGKVHMYIKEIRRARDAAVFERDMQAGTTVTEITEEQARTFWKKYGRSTTIKVDP